MSARIVIETRAEHCLWKLQMCLRHAREWRRVAWQSRDKREARINRELSRDAMGDALYWRCELAKAMDGRPLQIANAALHGPPAP